MYDVMYFAGKYYGPSIEKYIAHYKLVTVQWWILKVKYYLQENAYITKLTMTCYICFQKKSLRNYF